MKRIAFFVEGQTEQIFINSLAREMLGNQHLNIIQKQFRGGTNVPKQEIVISRCLSKRPFYEILIFDCGSDNRVKSEILDNIISLRSNGYSMIIGLRDLYPIPIDELDRLQKGLKFLPNRYKKEAPYFDIVIAIHEIETWFLAETTHFQRIDKRLTGQFINEKLGFNPYIIDPESRVHPAKDLNDIYQLVGKSYTKRFGQTQRIMNKLSFYNIIRNLRYELKPLNKIITIFSRLKENK